MATANGYVWRMTEVGSYGWVQSNYNHPYSNASVFGVRPVIVI